MKIVLTKEQLNQAVAAMASSISKDVTIRIRKDGKFVNFSADTVSSKTEVVLGGKITPAA